MRWSSNVRSGNPPGCCQRPRAISKGAFSGQTLLPLLKKHYAMGAVFEIVAYHAIPGHAANAMDKAFQEIDRLEEVMSAYKPESGLSRLNRTAHFRTQGVSPELYQAIKESLYYSELSEGAFDITVGPLAARWKAVGVGEQVPTTAEEKRLRRGMGYRRVEMIPPNRIKFHSSRLEVDLGAIGKGYAVDRAAAVLRRCGIGCALVNSGGSTFYAMGSPPGQRGWLVRLRDPSAQFAPWVRLQENSVSTSEQTPRSLLGMTPFGHIIDPLAGVPLKTASAVSVVAETATASDALSTALLLMGPIKGRELVTRLPKVAAVWITPGVPPQTATSGPEILMKRGPGAARNPD